MPVAKYQCKKEKKKNKELMHPCVSTGDWKLEDSLECHLQKYYRSPFLGLELTS